jgi:hypothetical protein
MTITGTGMKQSSPSPNVTTPRTVRPAPRRSSCIGVADPAELRVARIPSTMDPDTLVVSESVAQELRERGDVDVGPLRELSFEDGELPADPY